MLIAAYADGTDALTVALALTMVAVAASRAAMPGSDSLLRDMAVGGFVVVYLPLLAAFAMVMLAEPDGPDRIVVFILAVVLSDTGWFRGGCAFRPTPDGAVGQSQEVMGGLGRVLCLRDGSDRSVTSAAAARPLVAGALIGLVVVVTATLGDLAESLLKRDLGIKDMGHLLPEHGGVMDRLDSLLPTAPVVALLLAATVA